jgi:phenylpropionate dioxygenase-like ring-hydroxylating dioxygenase large terminal subunit
VWEGFGQSVVIARGDLGELTAFHNVCQHRGARIVPSPGHACELVCPWHGFVYDLTGRVTTIPRRALFDPALVAGLAAPAVAVAERDGFVWINLDAGARPLDGELGSLGAELAGYGMGAWQLVGAAAWPIAVNWKAVVDAFSEDYHADETHAATIHGGLRFDETTWTLFPPHSMMVTPIRGMAVTADHRRTAYCHYTAFPTTVASCFPQHAQVMSIVPDDVDHTELRVWVVAERGDERFDARMDAGFDHFASIAAEDVAVLEEVGATRRSIAHRRNILGRAEQRVELFQRVLDERLV